MNEEEKMSDLISRQAAIDAACEMHIVREEDGENTSDKA